MKFSLPWRKRDGFGTRLQDRRARWLVEWEDETSRAHLKKFFYKHVGKAYAADFGVRVPETYLLLESIGQLPEISDLPPSFVLKPFRGSSSRSVFVVGNGMDLFDNSPISREKIVTSVARSAAALDFTGPGDEGRYLVEELVRGEAAANGIPLDFKFYQFGREMAFVHVVERNDPRSASVNRHWFFNSKWQLLDQKIQRSQAIAQSDLPSVSDMQVLAKTAASIAGDLDMFVRVDLYLSNGEAVFGELTALPHGGKGYTPHAEEWLGKLWVGLEGVGGKESYAARCNETVRTA